jgi:hypothetical protein
MQDIARASSDANISPLTSPASVPPLILGSLLRFDKGRWLAGVDRRALQLGSEFRAYRKPVRHVFILDGKPDRSDLGDLDRSQWPLENGRPKDPWVDAFALYLECLATEAPFTFVTHTTGGKAALNDLVQALAFRARTGRAAAIPVVKLGTMDMRIDAVGFVPRPTLEVVRWEPLEPDASVVTRRPDPPLIGNQTAQLELEVGDVPF